MSRSRDCKKVDSNDVSYVVSLIKSMRKMGRRCQVFIARQHLQTKADTSDAIW